MNNFKGLVFVLLFAGSITACGNVKSGTDNVRTAATGLVSNSSATSSMSADQRCSANPNIIGNNNSIASEYRACAAASAVGSVVIYPADQTQKTVWIFPMRVSTYGQVSAVVQNAANPIETRFAFQSATIQATGSTVSFPGLNFNAMYVVNSQADARILAYCMAYGDVDTCAANSNLILSAGQF